MTDSPKLQKYTFEEYKMYYESAEKVTERRLAMNTWNYSICTAIVAGIAVLSNWSLVNSTFRVFATSAGILLSIIGFVLCVLWAGQIRDFKNLNDAKFKVLNDMAPAVQFGANDTRVSATPFAKEWEILKLGNSAQKVRFMNIIALRSSNVELYIPLAFCSVFFLIAAVAVGSAFLKSSQAHDPVDMKQTTAPPAQGKT